MERKLVAEHRPAGDDARAMDLAALIDAFRAATAAYFAGGPADNRFALELFRRAVLERSEEGWCAIYEAYRPLVAGWVLRHPAFHRSGEDSAYLVNRAFERFWCALRPERLVEFPGLPALLRYLKLCATCAVVDAARAYRLVDAQPPDESMPASEDRAGAEQADALLAAEQVWRTVATILHDPAQERLAWETLVVGLAPREVVATHPADWHSVGEVYRARARLLHRLRADPELVRLRDELRSCGPAAA
jgi:hypothetical protein